MVPPYPNQIASTDVLNSSALDAHRAKEGFGTRLLSWVRQTYCGLYGHDTLLQFQKDRIFLQCVSCGHESPGWELSKTAPPIRVRGDARRHGLAGHRLISARRIA